MMITVLLIVIVLLLLGIVAMMLTGWPGREQKEIEKTGQDLRRELAQHRADSIQLLHAMRIELEESFRETIEEQVESFELMNRRVSSKRKKISTDHESAETRDLSGDEYSEEVILKRGRIGRSGVLGGVRGGVRQLPLFQEKREHEEMVQMTNQALMEDDLPDIDIDEL